MSWLEAIVLGLIQGLTEFLPVSSSGHLLIGKELLGVQLPDEEAFLSFEVIVHAATVLATIVVFRKQIWQLLCGLFKFKYNDETDYVLKIAVSMVPVFVVGMFFKNAVKGMFSGVTVVGWALLATAVLLLCSDKFSFAALLRCKGRRGCEADGAGDSGHESGVEARGGISYWQAFVVGLGQAIAVIPGLSRSGTTIATGLLCGVRRDVMAQFSFLMVLVPILGEAFLDIVGGGIGESAAIIGALPLLLGFVSAFVSGLFACKVMIALVKRASLWWFSLYCGLLGLAIVILSYITI